MGSPRSPAPELGRAVTYKFLAFARTVPHTLRNPIYHWTHLELKRYFGIDTLLNESTAPENRAARHRATGSAGLLPARNILRTCKSSRAPAPRMIQRDDLNWHRAIVADPAFAVRVYPTFRPDKALNVHDAPAFNAWTQRLAAMADIEIASFFDFQNALRKRHDDFHALGGRVSDHGLSHCFADFSTEAEAAIIFDKARAGTAVSAEDTEPLRHQHDALFRPARRRKGLDEATAPRCVAEQQHPSFPHHRRRHRLRFNRRLESGRRAIPLLLAA